ncbi:patatin-like phospholipase family protein [Rhizobacter sp. LjRoot28]|uniref:patatin-like phospholipase family protein n=1 Tax=Rhizobacter sp. LjRoot28 TaxID=3342309 RepID=UPI003ED04A3F
MGRNRSAAVRTAARAWALALTLTASAGASMALGPVGASAAPAPAPTSSAELLERTRSASRGPEAGARPRIGVVLSGGGARGGAHLGVLKVLEELGVPIDVIVGTSAGAIVGAAYATGMPLAEIEREMAGLNTAMLFRDIDRAEVPMNTKVHDRVNYVGPEMGIRQGELALPKGAVAGISMEAVLRRLTQRQRAQDFDELPIPFRAVATDLATSEMVVLDKGSLAVAVRASMAIPAVVDPVELDGRLLVDGGPSRNLPVDVARALGVDVIIAVNIGTPLLKREEIRSVLSVSDQITRILTNTNVAASVREIRDADVLLTPDLGTVTTGDFDRLADAAQAGERAARDASARLARFAVAPAEYRAWRAAASVKEDGVPRTLADVRVMGTERVDPEVVTSVMRSKRGQVFDASRADGDVRRIYARGDFERVGYTLTEEPGVGHVLTAQVAEKSWGPTYLRFGLGLSTDLAGNAVFDLSGTHRATWLNRLGGEWRNDVQLGNTDRLVTEWYQPLTPAQRVFVAARAEGAREPFDLYDEEGDRIARYRRGTFGVGLDVGTPIGRGGEARLGVWRGRARLITDTGTVAGELLQPQTDTGGVLARVRYDTLDNRRFPRAGVEGELRLYASSEGLGADETYTKGSATFNMARAWGAHSMQVGLRGAKALDTGALPLHELFSLGGFLRLSGYKTGQFLGRELAFGRLIYNYRLSVPGLLDGAFVGVSAEAGRIGDSVSSREGAFTRQGRSVYLALDTPFGPVYGAFGRARDGSESVYLFLGQP